MGRHHQSESHCHLSRCEITTGILVLRLQMGGLCPHTQCQCDPHGKSLPNFGDVGVVHHALKKPPSFENRGTTGVCLGHDSIVSGGVLVVSVVKGSRNEIRSAKVCRLGEKVGQSWTLRVHPQDSAKVAYVCQNGEVKWNLSEIEAPMVEFLVREDAVEVQDIRELGMGWAWFVNDMRAFLPAWGKIWN